MQKNKTISRSFDFLIILWVCLLLFSCASTKNPQGGPRDTTPPKVVTITPKNLSTNFSAKKIVIEFNEYTKLQNEFKEFSISPEQERPPILKTKFKKLEITLQDSLEKNTTYTLNFGKSITDLNEGNILKNFSYVFSTGASLDSLSISGNVKNALTGKNEVDATVFILPLQKDSLVGKKRPNIYTSTDSAGNFKLKNLRKGTYKIYALKENGGGDKIYQQNSDEIGFIKTPLVLTQNIDSLKIAVFKELPEKFRVTDRKLNADGSISMVFNQKLKKPSIVVSEPAKINEDKTVRFNKTNDSVKVWLADLSFDSLKLAIYDTDKKLEEVKFTRGKKDTYLRNIQITDNTTNGLLNPNRTLNLYFNLPIQKIDVNKIVLLEDSIQKSGFTITTDSTDVLTYVVKYPWKKKENYILKIGNEAITGVFKSTNKEINKKFSLANSDDYGTLMLTVKVPDTTLSYILEIVNEKKENVVSSLLINKNQTLTFANYKAGIYYARIIYDENKNGIWDTGNVSKGLQPEKIWYETKELSIRANWDRKETIDIPKNN